MKFLAVKFSETKNCYEFDEVIFDTAKNDYQHVKRVLNIFIVRRTFSQFCPRIWRQKEADNHSILKEILAR